MRHSVRSISQEIVGREGGYVNDPDDPGGATKYGVTIHTMVRLGLDLDADGDVDVEDVKLLTVDNAVDIFVKHYFHEPGIWRLPEQLQPTVFDMQVNAGANAIKILQRTVNRINGIGPQITVDGKLGPNSASKVNLAWDALGDQLINAYSIARRNYYYSIGDLRRRSRKYARRRDGGKGGWIVRAEEFMDREFHLTDAQHRERVSEWR